MRFQVDNVFSSQVAKELKQQVKQNFESQKLFNEIIDKVRLVAKQQVIGG